MENEHKFVYSLDGKNWKALGEIKEINVVPVGPQDETKSLKLNQPFRFEAEIKFAYSKEVLKSLHYMRHSKKIRTRLKHARRILRSLNKNA